MMHQERHLNLGCNLGLTKKRVFIDGMESYYNHKQAFIESQIRLLEQEFITPSEAWISKVTESPAEERIPLAVVDTSNRKHHVQIFNRQSMRQILEQLQFIYDQKCKDALEGHIRVEKKDYNNIKWIESFPEEWPQLGNLEYDQEELDKYADLRSRVNQIQKNYITMKEKCEHYKNLREALAPLNKSTIQQNLVAKNAPVINEINKMRILLPKLLNTLQRKSGFLKKKLDENLKSESQDGGNSQNFRNTFDIVKDMFKAEE
ncbi:22300_t:CDS:2 [Dentiscutata erythropus]|uniref:22300_t:CDS:1 n=1 Tax=Dentiscutata erythropus TaxID=1348616 RepID=A0A9N9IT98_9GLOM|nr:22300_t:CDS:2 [Dentiscutata erythropus]